MTLDDTISVLGEVLIPVLTLVVTIYINREKFEFKLFKTNFLEMNIFFFTIANLLVGVLIISIGFLIEPFVYAILLDGIHSGLNYLFWRLSESPDSLLFRGLLPGTLTASVAMSSKTFPDKIRNSSFVAIVTLIVTDYINSIDVSTGRFFFSVICDIIGGVLAGIIISYLVVFLANFVVSTNKNKK